MCSGSQPVISTPPVRDSSPALTWRQVVMTARPLFWSVQTGAGAGAEVTSAVIRSRRLGARVYCVFCKNCH